MLITNLTPLVFISAVSGDLRSARDIVKNSVLSIGCHPIVQEHFEPSYQTVKEMLRSRIEQCQAVIHLVGNYYGGEPDPDSLPPGAARRSWTQMEYDMARELGKKTYLFVFEDAYPFDKAKKEPRIEVNLQKAHRDKILNGEHIYNLISTPEELNQRVTEMRLVAGELREQLANSTQEIASAVETIEREAGELKDGQQEILENVEKMSQSFSALAELGGIIPEPSAPEQFYFNAKLSEIKGDYGNARRYYIGYFDFEVECIDPHLRFIQFLKIQEGREGAAETYRHVVRDAESVVHELASSLLGDRTERIFRLEAFLEENPWCGPGYYLLAEEYSKSKLPTQTLEDKRRERQMLEQFGKLDEQGYVVRWFVDKSLVSDWREDAEYRSSHLESERAALDSPVNVSWLSHNNGWNGTIQIAELPTEIFWRPPGETDFISTGYLSSRCYSTGEQMPQQTIELAKVTESTAIEVAYKNLNGETMGPYVTMLEPFAESHEETKQILNISKRSWVSLRNYNGKTLLYFTHLLTHRGGLKQIAYGLNSDPRYRVIFPEYNKPGMAPIEADLPVFITIPNETQFVTVQVTFKDGEQSEIVRVDR